MLAGAPLDPPPALELLGAFASDSSLFLRYGVRAATDSAPARV